MRETSHLVGAVWAGLVVCAALCAIGATQALAAPVAPPPIPPGVQPGVVERELQRSPQAPQQAKIDIPAPNGFEAPGNAAEIHIKLTSIEVSGNSAVSSADFTPATQGLLGRDITVADLYGAANAITAIYVAKGYALCFAVVPAQSIEDGHARIDVIEGYVAEIKFAGDTARLPPALSGYGERIKASRPLKTTDLERFLLLANDVSSFTAKSTFDRIANGARGATRLVITLTQQPVAGSLTLDNRGSKAMGPWRADAFASFNNLLGQGEGLRLLALRALDGNELSYGSVDATLPLDDNGTSLVFAGSYSDANPGLAALSAINFASKGWTARLGVDHNVIRSRTDNLTLSFQATGKWLASDLASTANSRDRIFTLVAGASYWSNNASGLTTLGARATQGLDIFGATTGASPLRSKASGSGAYTALSLDAARLQSLGGNFDVYVSVTAQIASRGLLASEQCGYGGGAYGRGFDDSEIVGDNCAMGAAELRYNFGAAGPLAAVQPYGFFDAGIVSQQAKALPGEKHSEAAQSVGFGIRAQISDHFSGSVEFAQPISHDISQDNNRAGRVFVSLRGEF